LDFFLKGLDEVSDREGGRFHVFEVELRCSLKCSIEQIHARSSSSVGAGVLSHTRRLEGLIEQVG
jgi:hypothetical protein